MKHLLVLAVACTMTLLSTGQGIDVGPAPGTYLTYHTPEQQYQQARETEIWFEDFAEGIPADWSNEETSGIAEWEYRGPATTPDINVGTRGSCISDDEDAGLPIASPSWENGFVIFDSNYWDDNIGPCGNFGSGPAPGPHTSTLTTPSLDFTDYEKVGILFTQYHKNWQAETRVLVSVNGGEFEEIFANELASNEDTEPDMLVRRNISQWAGSQPDVRIRFLFEGSYYFWMVDDILLFELDDNNLHIARARYGDYNGLNPDNVESMEGLEYTIFPQTHLPWLEPIAEVRNYGAQPQTNVSCYVDVVEVATGDTVFSANSLPVDMNSDQVSNLTTEDWNMEQGSGEYEIHYSAQQDEIEETPEDNWKMRDFFVSDVQFGRDLRSMDNVYLAPSIFNGDSYETGNFFLISESGEHAHSISVGLSIGTITETEIFGAIYTMDWGNGLEASLVAQTEPQAVYWEALNDFGEQLMMVLEFTEPVPLTPGVPYLVMVNAPTGPETVLFGMSGDSPEFSSMIRFGAQSWFYMQNTPMVRLNLGTVVGVNEAMAPTNELYQNFPNPFTNTTAINYKIDQPTRVRITLRNAEGRLVNTYDEGIKPTGEHSLVISRDDLGPGVYTYTLVSETSTITKVMVIN